MMLIKAWRVYADSSRVDVVDVELKEAHDEAVNYCLRLIMDLIHDIKVMTKEDFL